ncbi:hypothetical protein D3C73_1264000 [compost metagenome]
MKGNAWQIDFIIAANKMPGYPAGNGKYANGYYPFRPLHQSAFTLNAQTFCPGAGIAHHHRANKRNKGKQRT